MKYRIWEDSLTEYTSTPGCVGTRMMIGEIEAESHLEAYEQAKLLFPNNKISRVDDKKTAYEFKDDITATRGLNS